jgi:hypothetical protein
MGLVRGERRSADVVATEDLEYVVLDEQFLRRLKRRYPWIAATVFLNLSKILSERLETTTEQLAPLRATAIETPTVDVGPGAAAAVPALVSCGPVGHGRDEAARAQAPPASAVATTPHVDPLRPAALATETLRPPSAPGRTAEKKEPIS